MLPISNINSQHIQFGARRKKTGRLAALALAGASLLGACGQSNNASDPQLRDNDRVVSTCKDQYFDRAKAAHFRNYPGSTMIICNRRDQRTEPSANFEFPLPDQMTDSELKAVLEDRYDEFQAIVSQNSSTVSYTVDDPLMQDSDSVVKNCGTQYTDRVLAAHARGYQTNIFCNRRDQRTETSANFKFPMPYKLTKDELRSILGEELYQTYKDHPAFQTKDAAQS